MTIDNVTLWNRTDCCPERLGDYDISILDSARNVVWTNYQSGYPDPVEIIDTVDAVGRYVRIQSRGSNLLSIAEVEVIAPAAL